MNTKIGRGRGRGRGMNNDAANSNPWSLSSSSPQKVSRPGTTGERQMIDMKAKYGKLIDSLSASDSSDEEIHNDEILNKLTKNFDDALESKSIFNTFLLIHFRIICCK